MQTTSRRRVLGWVAAIGVLQLLGLRPARDRENLDLALRLIRVVPYPLASARAIGSAYLEVVPDEAASGVLRQLVRNAVLLSGTEASRLSDAALAQLFQQRVTMDFESGRIASVDGWVLSRTEARLCALMALES